MTDEEKKQYSDLFSDIWKCLRMYLSKEPTRRNWINAAYSVRSIYNKYKPFRDDLAIDLTTSILAEVRRVYDAAGVNTSVEGKEEGEVKTMDERMVI